MDVPVIASNDMPKLKRRRPRSIDNMYFQNMMRRMGEVDAETRIVDVTVLLHQKNSNFHVLMGQEPTCDCQKQQVAGKTTCIHIIWCFVNIFGLDKTDPLLAQIECDDGVLRELLKKRQPEIPEHLKNFKSTTRKFHPKLLQHPKFSVEQHWFISTKISGAPARCSGCMNRRQINVGDHHLYA